MSGISMSLLLILWAIAVACAAVLWRYRLARPTRKASSEQAQQRARTGRTEAVNASARATGGINAPTDTDKPRPLARGAVSAPLERMPAANASIPLAATVIPEPQGDDKWLDTVPEEHGDPAPPEAPIAALLPSSHAANEGVNANANPAPQDGRNAGREKAASQTPAMPPPATEPPTAEEAPSAARQPVSETDMPTAPAAILAAQSAEEIADEPEPGVPSIGLTEEQINPPVQAWSPPARLDQAAEEPLDVEEELRTAHQPLPRTSIEPEPVADQEGAHRDVTASNDELYSSPAVHDGQQLWGSDQTANESGTARREEALVAVELAATVDRSEPTANDPVPAAMSAAAADAHVETSAEAEQPASAETIPFNQIAAPAVLGNPAAAPVHSQSAPAEAEWGSIVQIVRSDAHIGEQEPVVAGQVEAAFEAAQLNADNAVLPEQVMIAQADEVVELAEEHEPALDTGSVAEAPEPEITAGRADDLQPSGQDDTAQPAHAAESVDDTAEESPGAASELDDPDALFRDALSWPARQAVYRDRRGRQTAQPQPGSDRKRAKRQLILLRPPAEARLRLMVHPIRRTVDLALVLLRPAEFPAQVTLELNGSQTVDALDESQYGDVDLTWDAGLLLNEIRVSCAEGYQWVRGARPVHIFAADPAQAHLVSVPAATAGTEHTVICREQDTETVCDIAESAGSARPQTLGRLSGIPDGWVVLSGYRPTRAAALPPAQVFSPLDPGHGIEIRLQGGLETGRRLYAQGRPPRIYIEPMLSGVSVRIGGVPATVFGDGSWEALGWDAPGQHRIEVVPGPSLNYEIQADPGVQGGWAFWDAHRDRTAADQGPWSQAQICGAMLAGPSGERVIAAELQPTVLALGIDGSIGALRQRPEAGVSVGFATGMPSFLLFSSGRRRRQGKIVWLGLPPPAEVIARPRLLSQLWIEVVRAAAARQLAMQADEGGAGQSLWERAVLLARSAKRQRHG